MRRADNVINTMRLNVKSDLLSDGAERPRRALSARPSEGGGETALEREQNVTQNCYLGRPVIRVCKWETRKYKIELIKFGV